MKFATKLVLAAVAATAASAGNPDVGQTPRCSFNGDGSQTATSGSSDCPSVCPEIFLPVCGSDGMTYANDCFLKIAACKQGGITKVSDGACPTSSSGDRSIDGSGSSSCSEVCLMIFRPVCGSDGVTYSNDCLLGVASCKSDGAITQVSIGECPTTSSMSADASAVGAGSVGCPDACLDVYEPVADASGVQYSNECYMRIAQCHSGSRSAGSSSTGVVTQNSGERDLKSSSDCKNRVCTMDYAPVCGSNRVTYSNSCMLEIASCKDASITRVGEGQCVATYGAADNWTASSSSTCPDVCSALHAPVCGSDGVTYGNECELEAASCNHPDQNITKVADDACSSTAKKSQ